MQALTSACEMIYSDINPLSHQNKTCLWSVCVPKGASTRKMLELLEFLAVYLFSVWSGGSWVSLSLHTQVFVTFVTLDKHRLHPVFLIRNKWRPAIFKAY